MEHYTDYLHEWILFRETFPAPYRDTSFYWHRQWCAEMSSTLSLHLHYSTHWVKFTFCWYSILNPVPTHWYLKCARTDLSCLRRVPADIAIKSQWCVAMIGACCVLFCRDSIYWNGSTSNKQAQKQWASTGCLKPHDRCEMETAPKPCHTRCWVSENPFTLYPNFMAHIEEKCLF